MVSLVVVKLDEVTDLSFQFTRRVVVFEQQDTLHRPMIPFDLALSHWMIRSATNMTESLLLQVVSEFARDITRTVVAEQSRSVTYAYMIHT